MKLLSLFYRCVSREAERLIHLFMVKKPVKQQGMLYSYTADLSLSCPIAFFAAQLG